MSAVPVATARRPPSATQGSLPATITGVSVNPARSAGPALLVGGKALADLWVFILAPLAGGALAGVLFAAGLTRAA